MFPVKEGKNHVLDGLNPVERGRSIRLIAMSELGKILIFVGGALLVIGVIILLLGRTNLPLGRLPGDILYRGKHTTFYFPLATSIVISIVLSVVLYVIGRLKR